MNLNHSPDQPKEILCDGFHLSARGRTPAQDPAGCAGSVEGIRDREILNKDVGGGENQSECGMPPQTARNGQVSISERTNVGLGDVRKVSATQTHSLEV